MSALGAGVRAPSPQHVGTPPATAQVLVWPATIELAPLTPPAATGAAESVLPPSPSWPDWFQPQPRTPPPPRSTQVCATPAATPRIPLRPATGTATEESACR